MPIDSNDVTATQARAIADTVTAVDGVSGMHSGNVGEVAMLFPRARVAGLRVREQTLQVHITADPSVIVTGSTTASIKGNPTSDIFADLAQRVRAAIRNQWTGDIDVIVADICTSPDDDSDSDTAAPLVEGGSEKSITSSSNDKNRASSPNTVTDDEVPSEQTRNEVGQ